MNPSPSSAPAPRRRTAARGSWTAWLYVAPALAMYVGFVVAPLARSVGYSFYDWNGIVEGRWVGLANYARVLTDPALVGALLNSFQLIFFFTVLPVLLGLIAAATIHRVARGPFGAVARTTLFLPQVIPLVAAGITWKWAYANTGAVNELLRAVGLGGLARPWLADFDAALPAVGIIGTWVILGFSTVLLLSGLGKIDEALYEAARIDGAGPLWEFRAITVPGLVREIGVSVTVSMIAAIASFDIVFSTTFGGPGRETMVPGLLIYRLAFAERNVGLASALAVVLMLLIVVLVLGVQRFFRRFDA